MDNRIVFLLDVDNTLLANDEVKEDLNEHIQVQIGPELTTRFWEIYEEVRKEKDVVDIPASLARFRQEIQLSQLDQLTFQHVESLFNNYPFYKALYPYALETLQHLNTLGLSVIVSDGDFCFQAEKIVNSFLAETVNGRVLLYIHKQEHLDEIMTIYSAEHYIIIDDKPKILLDAKNIKGNQVITVFVRQGKYARQIPEGFQPDITVDHIGDLRTYTREQFLQPHKPL